MEGVRVDLFVAWHSSSLIRAGSLGACWMCAGYGHCSDRDVLVA